MEDIKKNFNDFNVHARIIPALLIALPIYIYLVINNLIEFEFYKLFNNSFIFIIIIALYYKFIRNLGKKYENKMYKELGEKPTTIVLRYSDNRIDTITKTRYHKTLNRVIKDIKLPLKKELERKEDDEAYKSAANWIRNYANSNKEREQRVYQELKDYNFWRNLYGGKIIITISCLITILIESIKLIVLKKNDFQSVLPLITMVSILLINFLVVRKEYVKEKAFDYAITLMEVCERI